LENKAWHAITLLPPYRAYFINSGLTSGLAVPLRSCQVFQSMPFRRKVMDTLCKLWYVLSGKIINILSVWIETNFILLKYLSIIFIPKHRSNMTNQAFIPISL